MNDSSERYADSAQYLPSTGRGYQFCHRKRCETYCMLQRNYGADDDRKWRYIDTVVVVSLEDGTKKYAFCSRKCAAQWLNSQET